MVPSVTEGVRFGSREVKAPPECDVPGQRSWDGIDVVIEDDFGLVAVTKERRCDQNSSSSKVSAEKVVKDIRHASPAPGECKCGGSPMRDGPGFDRAAFGR